MPNPFRLVELNLMLRQRAGARALVDYSTSSGATRPAGTALGGQAFSQAPFNVPESAREVLRGADGRPLVEHLAVGRSPETKEAEHQESE